VLRWVVQLVCNLELVRVDQTVLRWVVQLVCNLELVRVGQRGQMITMASRLDSMKDFANCLAK